MNMNRHLSSTAIAFLLAGCHLVGCNRQVTIDDYEPGESSQVASEDEAVRVVEPTGKTAENSPAWQSQDQVNASTPEGVCSQFLDALKSGDWRSAIHHLTTQATYEVRRADMELQPPGGLAAKYSIGETLYTDIRQQGAHVEFFVDVDDESPYKLYWVLKNTQSGWKISGMMMENERDVPELLSFESRTDVQAIAEAAQPAAPADDASKRHAQLEQEPLK